MSRADVAFGTGFEMSKYAGIYMDLCNVYIFFFSRKKINIFFNQFL